MRLAQVLVNGIGSRRGSYDQTHECLSVKDGTSKIPIFNEVRWSNSPNACESPILRSFSLGKKTHGQPGGFKRVSFVDELEACMARGAEVAEKADEVMQLGWQWLVSGEIMVVNGVFISAVYEC